MLQADADGWISARPVQVGEVLQRLLRFPKTLYQNRDLVSTSVKRDLGARFKGTVVGWFWPLLHPLFLFIVYYYIFTQLLQFKMGDLPKGQESALGVYMFVGILAWSMIAEGVIRGTNVIVENSNLIKKLAFPSELLPLNVTLAGAVTLVFGIAVFILACFVTPLWLAPGWGLLWVPVLVLLQCLFVYGLVLILSTLHVFLRDTLQVVSVLTTVWMFATPLFWVPEMITKLEGNMWMVRLNPIYHLVHAYRGALMGEVVIPERTVMVEMEAVTYPPFAAVSPDFVLSSTLIFAAWAVGLFIVGYVFFVIAQRRFADEV